MLECVRVMVVVRNTWRDVTLELATEVSHRSCVGNDDGSAAVCHVAAHLAAMHALCSECRDCAAGTVDYCLRIQHVAVRMR